jgi:hypothetical protein
MATEISILKMLPSIQISRSVIIASLMASISKCLPRLTMPATTGKATSQRLAAISRQFSSSPRAMSFKVKKLGVVGAGQMVVPFQPLHRSTI